VSPNSLTDAVLEARAEHLPQFSYADSGHLDDTALS
jgi:hypothetical protein